MRRCTWESRRYPIHVGNQTAHRRTHFRLPYLRIDIWPKCISRTGNTFSKRPGTQIMTLALPKSAEEILGLEYDWLASDAKGFVALFTTAGGGYAPTEFLKDTDAHDRAIDIILDLPATTHQFCPTATAQSQEYLANGCGTRALCVRFRSERRALSTGCAAYHADSRRRTTARCTGFGACSIVTSRLLCRSYGHYSRRAPINGEEYRGRWFRRENSVSRYLRTIYANHLRRNPPPPK